MASSRLLGNGRRIYFIGDRESLVSRMGSSTAALNFPLLFSPSVLSVTPGQGPTVGGTVVDVAGSNFQPGATVTFGGLAATGIVVVSQEHITCTTPAHAVGAVTVTVTNPSAQVGSLPNGFEYIPILTALGTNIAAYSFDNGATWTLGSIPAGTWISAVWALDRFVAITASGQSAFSLDGQTWSAGGALPQASGYQTVGANPTTGTVAAIRNSTTGLLVRSTDGAATWTNEFSPGAGAAGLNNVGWDIPSGNWIAIANANVRRSLDDAATWGAQIPVTSIGVGALRHTLLSIPARTIQIGTFAGANQIFSTQDGGAVWARVAFPAVTGGYGFAFSGTLFVARQISGTLTFTSVDGLAWVAAAAYPTASGANNLCFAGTHFLSFDGRNVRRTQDGSSWESLLNALPAGTWNYLAPQNEPGVSA